MVPAIAMRQVLITHCTTMNTRLSTNLLWKRNAPFITSSGLKRSRKETEINPDNNEMPIQSPTATNPTKGSVSR